MKSRKGKVFSESDGAELFQDPNTIRVVFDRVVLEKLYNTLNRREFVHPDPLEFLYEYPDVGDREIVAIIASSLAYGRVSQILKSVRCILELMETPRAFVESETLHSMNKIFEGFKHRFTTGTDVANLLFGIKMVLEKFGSLERCFLSGIKDTDETILPALKNFVREIKIHGEENGRSLLADPCKGSACKRLNLFLRWMVRNDSVDPGGWKDVSPAKLIIPLDTHMHNISLMLGVTRRRQANMVTALEITRAFSELCPEDPVKYDFCLTRYGIRKDLSLSVFRC